MKNKQVIAVSVDKVQTFLFEVVRAQVQEKQTESATLKNIKKASDEISKLFKEEIKKVFTKGEISEELMFCSGVYVFLSALEVEVIEEKLNQLFVEYYKQSQGQKFLRYAYFQLDKLSEIAAIQKAKKSLKEVNQLNKIVEKNRKTLFEFQVEKKTEGEEKNKKIEIEKYPLFAKTISDISIENDANHSRIAIIKADLDGMGDLFKSISCYETYREVSELLSKTISLNGLHNEIEIEKELVDKKIVFPFYVAGDDIFFAISISELTKGIDICRNIVLYINEQLSKLSVQEISMSIGVVTAFENEPIRYYLDRVEEELKSAKASKDIGELKECLQTKISINGLTFFDIDLKKEKELRKKHYFTDLNALKKYKLEYPIWQYFLHDSNHLKKIRKNKYETIGTTGFFYSLLEKLKCIEEENNLKYINNLLYCLLPEHLESKDSNLRTAELLLKMGIIKQIYIKSEEDRTGDIIEINSETKHRIETYLQLMLLFSDARFNIDESKRYKGTFAWDDNDKENVNKYLFSKPIKYLYKEISEIDFGRCFIQEKSRCIDGNSKKRFPYYQKIHVEKSMFFKLRETNKISVKKAADMISLVNEKIKKEVKENNDARKKEGKIPYQLYFDKKEFYKIASKNDQWNSDNIDSLMLFYEYNMMNIKFKEIYKGAQYANKNRNKN